jgi:hypothetical protein
MMQRIGAATFAKRRADDVCVLTRDQARRGAGAARLGEAPGEQASHLIRVAIARGPRQQPEQQRVEEARHVSPAAP